MRARWVILIVAAAVLFSAAGVGFVGWAAWQFRAPQAANPAELARERAADRAEAAAAFRDPVPPTPEQVAEFTPLLNRLAAAVKRRDAVAAGACFDTDRMADECGRAGAYDATFRGRQLVTPQEMRNGLRGMLGKAVTAAGAEYTWEDTRIRRVRLSTDGTEAVVIATHTLRDGDGDVIQKQRWWLTKRSGSWRVYDTEDLIMGMRVSTAMAGIFASATPDMVANVHVLRPATQGIQQAMVALARFDAEAAEEAIRPARGVNLPRPIAAFRARAEGMLAVHQERPDDALRFFDDADRLHPDMPVVLIGRAAAFSQLGRYGDSLAVAKTYGEQLGPDSIALNLQGVALENLGRVDEAVAAYRQALDENPNETDALSGLAGVLPAGQKAEVAVRLTKVREPEGLFSELVDDALVAKDFDAAGALVAAFRKLRPAHRDGIYYAARLALDRGNAADALPLLREACAAPEKDRPVLLRRVVGALASAGEAMAAYRAAPKAAAVEVFRVAADVLLDDIEMLTADGDDAAADRQETLSALVAARRVDAPADPWVSFFQGELHLLGNDYAAADAAFAAAAKSAAGDAADRDRIRGRRVFTRYKLKRGLEAYKEFGPASDVFKQLAGLYEGDRDPEGILALVAEHAKRQPADPAGRFWAGTGRWLKYDYAAAVAEYTACLKAAAEKEDRFYFEWTARDRIVRGLVRLHKPADARAALERFDHPLPLHAALVAAAGGDAPATLDAVRKLVEESHFTVESLYRDEDLGPLLRGEAMKAVREKYPPPPPPAPPRKVG